MVSIDFRKMKVSAGSLVVLTGDLPFIPIGMSKDFHAYYISVPEELADEMFYKVASSFWDLLYRYPVLPTTPEQNRLLTGLTRLCGIGFQVLDAGVGQKINPRMLREHADDGGIGAHALGHDHKGAAGNLLDYAGAGVQVPAQSVHVNTHSGVHGLRTRSFLCSAVGAVEAGTAAALMAAIPCFRLVLPVGAHIIAHGLALLNVPL